MVMLKLINEKKEFPLALPLRKLLGPSFIILALGLGSGEVILWPYLVSNYGLGIAWGALLGITFQYFINMEIERYALVKGESVFVGLARIFKYIPYWFILSTFIGFGLPGIIAASAEVMSEVFGLENYKYLAIVLLILIGLILSSGRTVYGLMEKITMTILLIGVPLIFLLAIALGTSAGWTELLKGLIGKGNGYNFLPAGISLATFLAAFAYSGAGGNLNLTQSIYIKEKGYGMGMYAQKIAGLFRGKNTVQSVKLSGENFEINDENISRFKKWWRVVSWEHLLVFWLMGSLSMLFLMVLAYGTAYGLADNAQGIHFVLNEGVIISGKSFPFIGSLFLVAVSIMLFQTQLGIMDSTSRIMSENFVLRRKNSHLKAHNLGKIYYVFVWAQIAFGVILFLFNIYEPKSLIILGAVINAVAMFVHVGLVSILNRKSLPKECRPGKARTIIITLIFLFFGFFSALVLLDKLGVLKF
jgi:hypothetical protein